MLRETVAEYVQILTLSAASWERSSGLSRRRTCRPDADPHLWRRDPDLRRIRPAQISDRQSASRTPSASPSGWPICSKPAARAAEGRDERFAALHWRALESEGASCSIDRTASTIRTYQVGFGDCFLLSFDYAEERTHVLIDFGSTALPKGVAEGPMADREGHREGAARSSTPSSRPIATRIISPASAHQRQGHRRHHPRAEPELVIQPWTEDPDWRDRRPAPGLYGRQVLDGAGAALADHACGRRGGPRASQPTVRPKTLRRTADVPRRGQSQARAVKNLMAMGENKPVYVFDGAAAVLAALLPGVKVHVLGPPTVKQTAKVKKYAGRRRPILAVPAAHARRR